LIAHQHARAQADAAPRLAFELITKEIAEYRVIHERVTLRLDGFARIDIDYGGHRPVCRVAEGCDAASRGRGRLWFCYGDDVNFATAIPCEQIRTQRRDYE